MNNTKVSSGVMKLVFAIAVGVLVVILAIYFFPKPPVSNPTSTTRLDPESSSRSVRVPGFDQPVLIPPNTAANFENPFGYTDGAGKLETDTFFLNLRPIGLPAILTDEQRAGTTVKTKDNGFDTTSLFDVVSTDKNIVRSKSSNTESITYYQRESRDSIAVGRIVHFPIMIASTTETTAKGYTATVFFKSQLLTKEQKEDILKQTDTIIIALFP